MKRILIIDDDELLLFGLSKAIRTCGADQEIVTARNGRQAVDILDSRQIDLIVTDEKLTIMSGYELVDYTRTNFPDIPVYVMTGDYLPEVKPKFPAAAVFRFVSKPFSFRQLALDIVSKLTAAEQPAPA